MQIKIFEYSTPEIFQLLYQLKIIFDMLYTRTIFKKRITSIQYTTTIIIISSIALSNIRDHHNSNFSTEKGFTTALIYILILIFFKSLNENLKKLYKELFYKDKKSKLKSFIYDFIILFFLMMMNIYLNKKVNLLDKYGFYSIISMTSFLVYNMLLSIFELDFFNMIFMNFISLIIISMFSLIFLFHKITIHFIFASICLFLSLLIYYLEKIKFKNF
jgi:hypothetical protein